MFIGLGIGNNLPAISGVVARFHQDHTFNEKAFVSFQCDMLLSDRRPRWLCLFGKVYDIQTQNLSFRRELFSHQQALMTMSCLCECWVSQYTHHLQITERFYK